MSYTAIFFFRIIISRMSRSHDSNMGRAPVFARTRCGIEPHAAESYLPLPDGRSRFQARPPLRGIVEMILEDYESLVAESGTDLQEGDGCTTGFANRTVDPRTAFLRRSRNGLSRRPVRSHAVGGPKHAIFRRFEDNLPVTEGHSLGTCIYLPLPVISSS